MRCLGANEACGECHHHADDRQGSEPAGAAIAQGGDRQGEPDDEQAHAATNGDDAGDRLPLGLPGDEGDGGAFIDHVNASENGGHHQDQQARDRQVHATGDGARAMRRHGTRGPLTRPGSGRRSRPAGVGLAGASGGRARPGVRALSGGGGASGAWGARATCASCGDAVGGETLGGLSVLLLRHGGARVLSARGAVPKRVGGSRRRRLLLRRTVLRVAVLGRTILRIAVLRISVLRGGAVRARLGPARS